MGIASTTTALAQRAKREIIRYSIVVAYLFVCLSALLLYKTAILHGVEYSAFGIALIKAMILGKFILVAEAFRIGERVKPGRLMLLILWKSLLFALVLVLLSLIEEVIVGLAHGSKVWEVVASFAGGTAAQLSASTLLMTLIMIPYFAFGEISAHMGEGQLLRLLMDRPKGDRGA